MSGQHGLSPIFMSGGSPSGVDKVVFLMVETSGAEAQRVLPQVRVGQSLPGDPAIGLGIFVVRIHTRDKSLVTWYGHIFWL